MEDTVVDELQRCLDASLADIAALVSSLPPEMRADAVNRLGGFIGQVTGARLDLLHDAYLNGSADDDVPGKLLASCQMSRRKTFAQIRYAADLNCSFPLIGRALRDGTLSPDQAEAVILELRKVPLGAAQIEQAQLWLIERAAEFGPEQLRQFAAGILEILDPEAAEQTEAARLEREERLAHRNRHLIVEPDHHGSVRIHGQVTAVVGTTLIAQLDSLMPSVSSYGDEPLPPSRATRRADALERLIAVAATSSELPESGGDRPRVFVALNYSTLTEGIGQATLTDTGQRITPATVRSLACHADLIPAVLGTDSQPLDVGRDHRLVTKAIRAALTQRDKGCAFPLCDAPAPACEAHHIRPWWAGGRTSIDNMVLLCPHHHRVVEPDPHRSPSYQWVVRINPYDKLPELLPPVTVDPDRAPRRHQRHSPPGSSLPPPTPEPPPRRRESVCSPAWVA